VAIGGHQASQRWSGQAKGAQIVDSFTIGFGFAKGNLTRHGLADSVNLSLEVERSRHYHYRMGIFLIKRFREINAIFNTFLLASWKV
jgi:hypothetical protein